MIGANHLEVLNLLKSKKTYSISQSAKKKKKKST